MEKLIKIDKELTRISNELVSLGPDISEIEILKSENALHALGHAISKIQDIQNLIYKNNPDLMPEKWNEGWSDEELETIYQDLMVEVDEYVKTNNIDKAIERLKAFIGIRPGESFEQRAKSRVNEIKKGI